MLAGPAVTQHAVGLRDVQQGHAGQGEADATADPGRLPGQGQAGLWPVYAQSAT